MTAGPLAAYLLSGSSSLDLDSSGRFASLEYMDPMVTNFKRRRKIVDGGYLESNLLLERQMPCIIFGCAGAGIKFLVMRDGRSPVTWWISTNHWCPQ